MKKMKMVKGCTCIFLLMVCLSAGAQNPENWTKKDLTEPADLAAAIRLNKNVPILFSIGPSAVIPNSIDIGMVKNEKNLAKFQVEIGKLPKSANILIYCGCCPFEHCPDVRPAIALLQKMQFTNYHLLDLPHNIKLDWIAKGYPTASQ